LLASDGIATRSFDNAETFLAHIKMHMVALVVLDIWMERITGLEVLTRLCVISPQTRVIVITARDRSRGPRRGDAKPPAGLFLLSVWRRTFLAAVHDAARANEEVVRSTPA